MCLIQIEMNVMLDNFMLRAVRHFQSIWKVCLTNINGYIGVPECISFQGIFWINYETVRL